MQTRIFGLENEYGLISSSLGGKLNLSVEKSELLDQFVILFLLLIPVKGIQAEQSSLGDGLSHLLDRYKKKEEAPIPMRSSCRFPRI